jgi:uncharacterized protein (DUF4213/DUF364 family)
MLSAVVRDVASRSSTDDATFDRVTVGDAAVLVELANEDESGSVLAGLAHRPSGSTPTPAPWTELTPLALASAVADEAASGDDGLPGGLVTRAVGIATLNALCAPNLAWQSGDPMALLDPDVDIIVTVGLFRPAFRKFGDVEVRVVERAAVGDVATPDGVTLRTFEPAATAAAMAGADVVFVTGSTLVYGGIERYLAAAPATATVVCIGATASMLPDAFFEAGVDVLAGATVDDVDAARDAVAAGACGTDLHDSGVRKVFVARETPAGIDL